jgi:hypothetical protein
MRRAWLAVRFFGVRALVHRRRFVEDFLEDRRNPQRQWLPEIGAGQQDRRIAR